MAFKNFSDESEADRGQPVLDGADTSLQAHAPPDNPLGTSDSEASSAFDSLALFFSEDAATASGTAAAASQDQRTSWHGAAPGADRPGPVPQTDSKTVDDLRTQLRQTEMDFERRSAEVADRLEQAARIMSALEHDLASLKKQLRTLDPGGLRPVVVHKELESHIQFVEPNDRTVTAGSLLPDRVRVLTHTLQRASTALGDGRDRIRIRLRRATRDLRPGGSQARSPIVHAFVRTSGNAIGATPAVLPDLGAMTERAPQRLTTTRAALPILARAQKSRAPARLWVAVVGVLVVLLGFGVTRLRDYPTPIASPERIAPRDLAAPAPVAALPGRPLGSAIFVMPENGSATMIGRRPTGDVPDDARPTEDLVRPPAVAALATGASGVVPSARRSATAPLRDTSPAQRFIGDLTVESLPSGATVFIDQRDVGRTPVQVRRLRAGSHVIRIEHEGYERWTSTALVPADQQTRVRAKLQPDCCPELRRISY